VDRETAALRRVSKRLGVVAGGASRSSIGGTSGSTVETAAHGRKEDSRWQGCRVFRASGVVPQFIVPARDVLLRGCDLCRWCLAANCDDVVISAEVIAPVRTP
jgi:hypothetical protein